MFEGVLLVQFAGILTGTFMWPMKIIRKLPFEIYIYPMVLIVRNRSASSLKSAGKEIFLSAIIGIQLITGAILLGRGDKCIYIGT